LHSVEGIISVPGY